MSARPFQVGDRVRIVGWDTYGPHEGTITEILPARMRTEGFLAGVPRSALIVTDCEYTLDSGSTALACAALNTDLTGAGWYGGQIELIDAADDAGRVHDVAEAERLAYAVEDEWVDDVDGFCDATVHQWDGIDSGELGPCGQPATGTAIGQTGRPFSVCNEHADNTTPERCTSQYSGFQCSLPVHDGLHVSIETSDFWTDHGGLIERPVWDDERHIWVVEHTPELPDDGRIENAARAERAAGDEHAAPVVDTFAPPADAPRAWEGWVPPIELLPEWMYGGDPHGSGVFAVRRDEAELERPVLQNSMAGLMSIAKVA